VVLLRARIRPWRARLTAISRHAFEVHFCPRCSCSTSRCAASGLIAQPYELVRTRSLGYSVVLLLERARLAYGDAYGDVLRRIPGDLVLSHRARLLYPDPHAAP